MIAGLTRRHPGRCDHGGIGRPPAHVAGPFVKIAIDQFDCVEREIDQARALGFFGHAFGQGLQGVDLRAQFLGHAVGNGFDLG